MRGIHTRPGRSTRARRGMAIGSALTMAAGFFLVSPQSRALAAASPTISTHPNANPIVVGGSDFFTANFDTNFVPGGSDGQVTYTVFTDSACTTGPQSAGT